MSKINKDNEVLIKAKVLDHLIEHLQKRTDVQNIDLMNLSGFCRNCLSKWYAKYANEAGYDLDYEETRKIIYGMPYSCLLYTSPSPRDRTRSRMPSSA